MMKIGTTWFEKKKPMWFYSKNFGLFFQFQSFSERIANVNIDVIHRIRQHDFAPEVRMEFSL